jgi:hypothetical protein
MQHFLNLEKCNCGAYRYLAVREHKKSYEIYLIHHLHYSNGDNLRKYSKLASIPKFRINIHDQRTEEAKQSRSLDLNFEEIFVLKSVLRKLEGNVTQESSVDPQEIERQDEDRPHDSEDPILALS